MRNKSKWMRHQIQFILPMNSLLQLVYPFCCIVRGKHNTSSLFISSSFTGFSYFHKKVLLLSTHPTLFLFFSILLSYHIPLVFTFVFFLFVYHSFFPFPLFCLHLSLSDFDFIPFAFFSLLSTYTTNSFLHF